MSAIAFLYLPLCVFGLLILQFSFSLFLFLSFFHNFIYDNLLFLFYHYNQQSV